MLAFVSLKSIFEKQLHFDLFKMNLQSRENLNVFCNWVQRVPAVNTLQQSRILCLNQKFQNYVHKVEYDSL